MRRCGNIADGRAEAVRRAMLAMINTGEPPEAHPALWAPFVVVGEGSAVAANGAVAPSSSAKRAPPKTKAGDQLAQRHQTDVAQLGFILMFGSPNFHRRRRGSEMSQTTADVFVQAMRRAEILIETGRLPKWFRTSDCYIRSAARAAQYKLPADELLPIALGLSIALTRTPFTARDVNKAFDGALGHLKRAREHLSLLDDCLIMPGDAVIEELPEDQTLITMSASPIEEFLAQMHELSTALVQARKRMGSNRGTPVTYLHYALVILNNVIERHNPQLPLRQRERLCEELFDEVRARQPKGRGADVPAGYRAMLKRIAKKRRKTGSQLPKK